MTKPERKQRIEELRLEGREAFMAGTPLEGNPYGGPSTPDGLHWSDGWHLTRVESERSKRSEIENVGSMLRLTLATAIHEYTSGPTEFAMTRLLTTLSAWEDHIVERTKGELNAH